MFCFRKWYLPSLSLSLSSRGGGRWAAQPRGRARARGLEVLAEDRDERDEVLDRATYEKGDVPAAGIHHVLVGGTFVVRDQSLVEDVYPGRAIKSARP